ncbi:YdaS family helix-turn-helix protein [Variovorax ginsengisoli]|uniref:YdaS family helix-turn-helix protein n=1 Tax=Variovorax ginsengisoli TaxID=363844 RepID=A0ABT8SFQ1_9BURK|nr:YdaS family helix-turn-helix protein [Variovorax ginsengisoli]MDN8617832.1 YdaS family helix-turn-helix protein [Variovorax ginsengisoli]MDO1537002.1 YdaS family helix-turn-helix protein [Variovorax ginsengisoli]
MAETTEFNVDCIEAEAVRLLGGPVSAARELGVDKYQTVQSWVKNGIPAKYCSRVELLTGIDRKLLRPTDWADYWPELAGPKGVPPVEAKAVA